MEAKLTIKLRKSVIEDAKQYAKNHSISLSKIIESYLESITMKKVGNNEISPLVESLSGVIKLDNGLDFKNEYSNYLSEKYK